MTITSSTLILTKSTLLPVVTTTMTAAAAPSNFPIIAASSNISSSTTTTTAATSSNFSDHHRVFEETSRTLRRRRRGRRRRIRNPSNLRAFLLPATLDLSTLSSTTRGCSGKRAEWRGSHHNALFHHPLHLVSFLLLFPPKIQTFFFPIENYGTKAVMKSVEPSRISSSSDASSFNSLVDSRTIGEATAGWRGP